VLLRSQKQRIVKDTKGACSAGALRRIEFAVWLIVTRRETIERITLAISNQRAFFNSGNVGSSRF
jgi:hypothetical protein